PPASWLVWPPATPLSFTLERAHAPSDDRSPEVSGVHRGERDPSAHPRACARGGSSGRPVRARRSDRRGAAGRDGIGKVHVPLDHGAVPAAHRGAGPEGTGAPLG